MAFNWLAVINPESAGGRTRKRWLYITKLLNKLQIKYDEVFTEFSSHAINIVQEKVSKYDGILVIGGDGTVNEVINGIMSSSSSDTVLGIIPSGTGNDIANSFGLSSDIVIACKIIAFGVPKTVDIGVTKGRNFENKIVSRYFAGVASFGFDADVSNDANNSTKRLSGTANYIVAVFKNLVTMKDRPFKVTLLEKGHFSVIEENAYLLAVGNSPYYGGGMKICPDADFHDGRFSITLVKGVSKLEFIKVFPSVFKGEHLKHPAVMVFDAPELVIKTGMKTLYQVDGEVIGPTPVKVTTISDALKVMLPK